MCTLIIKFPNSYNEEKRYISDVIFNDFIGVEYELLFEDERLDVELNVRGENGRIILPEILFKTPYDKWLNQSTLPELPLKRRSLDEFQKDRFIQHTVPVLYGASDHRPFFKDDEYSYFDIDLIGSIFFCLTLYEEATSEVTDKHGRFPSRESILYKEGIYDRPIVNEYVLILEELLRTKFNYISPKKKNYKLVLSHDMDYSLSHEVNLENFLKSCAGDLFIRKSPALLTRRLYSKIVKKERLHENPDPMNNIDYLMDVSESLGVVSEFNFIVEQGKGTIDVRYDIEKQFYKDLMVRVRERGHILGVHPSYTTYCDLQKTQSEFKKFKRLCSELGVRQEFWGGRHHYLRWKNPVTWSIWDEMGADYDSSVGSSELMGFRAGTCYPYKVFDLKNRKRLKLLERPLIVMDHSIFKMADFKNAVQKVIELSKLCKFYGGEFSLLYHNNYVISKNQKLKYFQLVKALV
ncbi:polysaccharide deacetylase family protein [Solitalea sp. MAHUQ-68]|uniref:Polysaccharide deacetylase family protein n=1 Tax=Solitalea agri TaxID=2953739 RepID=A0A9X2JE72_9SPHI|nr:polysaccharide deacetylase family protein [Solitalea agri]MCO4293650.1 polysaccharide deacetylase family protein [Solitalea agri]